MLKQISHLNPGINYYAGLAKSKRRSNCSNPVSKGLDFILSLTPQIIHLL
jgi:hypothetical protein